MTEELEQPETQPEPSGENAAQLTEPHVEAQPEAEAPPQRNERFKWYILHA